MGRDRNTDRDGHPFCELVVQKVWEKGLVVFGVDPHRRRMDPCGAWIDREHYGVKKKNGAGWEIDHIVPVAAGGSDELDNLQPLQWENNRHKGDYLGWNCLKREGNSGD